jgi:tRNA threonylcarbamoyl adenosine modification protein (Sua5/YciO/YrdC/YwlC family)
LAQLFHVHLDNPQARLLRQAVQIIQQGGVVVYPTDSCYAIGCHLGDSDGMARIRRIRGVGEDHFFTLMCRDLAEIARYAKVDNVQFRLLKAATPGSFTFILPATKEVPKRLLHPKRRYIGIRVPDHKIAQALLTELGEPLLSMTLLLPDDELPLNNAEEIRDRLEHQVDLVIDGGACGIEMSTVIGLTDDVPSIIRLGKGPVELLGLQAAD